MDHKDYLKLLRSLREIPKVKKVFIRSGIRFDYVMADPDDSFLWELCRHHVSGQLKVAPEHVSDAVLSKMGKPEHKVYQALQTSTEASIRKSEKTSILCLSYVLPSRSTLKEAIKLRGIASSSAGTFPMPNATIEDDARILELLAKEGIR